jgi:hydroxymethylglutaryl-CoA synthase
VPGPAGQIVACGAYVPRLRLSRACIQQAMGWLSPPGTRPASGSRAVCNWDEDSLTLAVAAARNCLQTVGNTDMPIGSVTLASTTLPFADRSNATLLAGALDLPTHVQTMDLTGTLRCGVTALTQAAAGAATALVVAADARLAKPGSVQELEFGAAGVAFLVRTGQAAGAAADAAQPAVLAEIVASDQLAEDFVDHYRMSAERFDYALEERWVRDAGLTQLVPAAIATLLKRSGVRPEAVDHCVLPGNPATVRRLAQGAGLRDDCLQDNLRADCGDTGAAHPLLMLAAVLERATPGQHILLVSFGQGVEVVLLRVPQGAPQPRGFVTAVLQQRCPETSYTRYLAHRELLEVDFGMRAERDNRSSHSAAWRRHRQITGFVGGRCNRCATVQFPRSRVCVNPECRCADTQDDFRLAETTGRIKSFTEDWQAFAVRPPAVYGNVEFEPGGNLLMDITDVETGELRVGDRVSFVFRIKDFDRTRGFRRYFWKARRTG